MPSPSSQSENAGFPPYLLHPRHWASWLGIGVYYLVCLLPVSWLDYLGIKLGHLMMRHNAKRYQVVSQNLKMCFGQSNDNDIQQLARQHYEFLARSLLHYGISWWGSEKKLKQFIQTEGFEQVEEMRAQGQNVIILISHCTGLEFAVSAITQAFESSGPYKPFKNPVVDWLILRARQRFGCRTFTRDDGLRPIINDARQGRVIIYLADEDLGPDVSVFAPLFGNPKATIPVIGRLAKSCKATVLPAFSCYDPTSRQYRIKLFEPVENFPSGDKQIDAEIMNSMIEDTIEYCPAQYLWILKIFKTRPEGLAKVYP